MSVALKTLSIALVHLQLLNVLSKFWQIWDPTKELPTGFINNIAKMLQVEPQFEAVP